ncbi:MAG TPA: hypothetical protein VK472_01210 [Allosphingosinicella sp.]|nr:hypothetical protein [Allosphingosinicella sp.]
MRKLSDMLRFTAAAGLAAFAAAEPALAGITPVPGPVIGAGLPALALFGAGYWLIRRRRRA